MNSVTTINADDASALAALERIGTIVHQTLAEAPGVGLDRSYRRAKALYAERRRRDRAFEGCRDLFLEPAWDILLYLFVSEHEDRRVAVPDACLAARVSQSTALRNLKLLEQRGLIASAAGRTGEPQAVKLTPAAYAQMQTALASMGPWEAPLGADR